MCDSLRVVLGDQSGSFKGRLWVYLDPLGRQVVFDATATHERDGPAAWLAAFRGKLQADAYARYDRLYQTGHVLEVGCMAHARRRMVWRTRVWLPAAREVGVGENTMWAFGVSPDNRPG